MSITTYGELKTALSTRLARSDLTTQIPEFITSAESLIAYGAEELIPNLHIDGVRVSDMETEANVSISGGEGTFPADFLGLRRVTWVDGGTDFNPAGAYTIEGSKIIFPSGISGTAQILYYAKYTAFSDDADTNWLLTNAHDIYVQGALIEAYSFIRNDNEHARCVRNYAGRVAGLNSSMAASKVPISDMIASPDVVA